MKTFRTNILPALLIFCCSSLFAQHTEESPEFVADSAELTAEHIRYQWVSLKADTSEKAAVAELIITNLKATDRDFAMNVYGTVLKTTDKKEYLFSQLSMGRITVKLTDRQNYLRYLLPRDQPTRLQVSFPFSGDLSAVSGISLVVESGTEAGRFDTIRLQKPGRNNSPRK